MDVSCLKSKSHLGAFLIIVALTVWGSAVGFAITYEVMDENSEYVVPAIWVSTLVAAVFLLVMCGHAISGECYCYAVIVSVFISLLFTGCGVLIAINTARNPDGKSWGGVAATLNFVAISVPWLLICGTVACRDSSTVACCRFDPDAERSRRSNRVQPRPDTPLSEEDVRRFEEALRASIAGETLDLRLFTAAFSELTESKRMQLVKRISLKPTAERRRTKVLFINMAAQSPELHHKHMFERMVHKIPD